MSTRADHYVMYGVRYPYPESEAESELLDDIYCMSRNNEDPRKLFCVMDGMDGEYVFVGWVLHKGNQFEGFKPYTFQQPTAADDKKLQEQIKKQLGRDSKGEHQLHIFTHWH